MKIALGQMNVVAGQIDENLSQMKKMIEQAKQEQAELIVFPKLCVSGCLLGDKWLDNIFLSELEEANEKILSWSIGIGILFGNISTKPFSNLNKTNDKSLLSCAYFAYNQQWVKKENSNENRHLQRQNNDVRFYNESRYFDSGKDEIFSPFVLKKDDKEFRVAVEISNQVHLSDADLVVCMDASPYIIGENHDEMIKDSGKNFPIRPNCFVYVNCVGMQNNGKSILVYDGGSSLYTNDGIFVDGCNDSFASECKVVSLLQNNPRKRSNKKTLSACVNALKEFDKQIFSSNVKWILGVSGGLDSTVNAALLSLAIGSDRVIGYSMSSKYNSEATKNNARMLCEKLNIRFHEGSIEACTNATIATLKEYGYKDEYPSLVYENIQARCRGHLLSTFASIEGGVVLNNGNKVETALGYCTLYGDAVGAISPIGDLTKVDLFTLAKDINDTFNATIIPDNLIPQFKDGNFSWETLPSAELKDAQFDPMKWYYHDWLIEQLTATMSIEDLMQSYLDDSIFEREVGKWLKYYKLDNPKNFIDDLKWVMNTMKRNSFKRYQTPPLLTLSKGSFGNDIQEVQMRVQNSKTFNELVEKILNKK